MAQLNKKQMPVSSDAAKKPLLSSNTVIFLALLGVSLLIVVLTTPKDARGQAIGLVLFVFFAAWLATLLFPRFALFPLVI